MAKFTTRGGGYQSLSAIAVEVGITPRIARRGVGTSAKLVRHRWVVGWTFAWFAQFRRLATRYDRRAGIHMALAKLATAIIRMKQIRRFC